MVFQEARTASTMVYSFTHHHFFADEFILFLFSLSVPTNVAYSQYLYRLQAEICSTPPRVVNTFQPVPTKSRYPYRSCNTITVLKRVLCVVEHGHGACQYFNSVAHDSINATSDFPAIPWSKSRNSHSKSM